MKVFFSSLSISKKKVFWTIFSLCIIAVVIVSFWGLLVTRNIHVIGNEYLKTEVITKVLRTSKSNLWNLDKKRILTEFKENPFIKEVILKTGSFRSIIVELKLVNLVAKTNRFEKLEYIDEKGQSFTGDFVKKTFFIPEIKISKDFKQENLVFLSQQLAIFKFSYFNFFNKIIKMDLLDVKNVSIFIVSDTLGFVREYRLYQIPSVQDFIKIEVLDAKYNRGSVIILDGESVIIQS